jgi:hypothetical protein
MELRAQIVTQLVAAFMTDSDRMQDIRNSFSTDWLHNPDYVLAVHYANIVADEIIDKTTPEIVFTDKQ